MKKLLLTTAIATVAAAGVYAQGTIAIDNLNNANSSVTATSGGLVFLDGALYSGTLSVEVLGGANATSLSPIATLVGSQGGTISGGPGLFFDSSGGTYAVPGVALSGTATLEVEAWDGNFTTFAAAVAGGADIANVTFQNGTGGGGSPPATPVDLIGMPAVNLVPTPEPTTIALGGLGAAALLLFRRRK